MAKVSKKKPVVTVRYERCELFSTFEMTCPLCGAVVPPSTPHVCKKEAK